MPHKMAEFANISLMIDTNIATKSIALSAVFDASGWMDKTVYIKADGVVTVSVLGGADEEEMCKLVTGDLGSGDVGEDGSLSWVTASPDDLMKCWPIKTQLQYMQIKVANATGSTVVVSLWVSGG